jgi:hypothetical protein
MKARHAVFWLPVSLWALCGLVSVALRLLTPPSCTDHVSHVRLMPPTTACAWFFVGTDNLLVAYLGPVAMFVMIAPLLVLGWLLRVTWKRVRSHTRRVAPVEEHASQTASTDDDAML